MDESRPLANGSSSSHILFVDTSIAGCSVALACQEAAKSTLIWQHISAENPGSAKISTIVEEGLRHCKMSVDNLNGIVVSPGPGSFTGIRIGLAWAYGFWAPRSKTLKIGAFSSLAAGARRLAAEHQQKVVVFLPSTRTHGFVAIASANHAETSLLDLADAEQLTRLRNDAKRFFCVGAWPSLEQNFGSVTALAPASFLAESLQGMVHGLGPRYWEEAGSLPLPVYLRKSTAEEKLFG